MTFTEPLVVHDQPTAAEAGSKRETSLAKIASAVQTVAIAALLTAGMIALFVGGPISFAVLGLSVSVYVAATATVLAKTDEQKIKFSHFIPLKCF